MDLQAESRSPIVNNHVFFATLGRVYPRMMRVLCHQALQSISALHGDVVFSAGDICSRMYFVEIGCVIYTPKLLSATLAKHRQVLPVRHAPTLKTFLSRRSGRSSNMSYTASAKVRAKLTNGNSWKLTPPVYLCEAVLWTRWEHCGELMVASDATLLTVDAETFGQVMKSHPPAHASTVLFARRFILGFNRFGKVYHDVIGPSALKEMLYSADTGEVEVG